MICGAFVFIPVPVKTGALEGYPVLVGDYLSPYYGVAQENFRTKSNCAAPCLLLFSRGAFISSKKYPLAADSFSHRCVATIRIKCSAAENGSHQKGCVRKASNQSI